MRFYKSLGRSAAPFFIALLTLSLAAAEAQVRQRRNFYGNHNLMDGGAAIPEGMNWTRHMVGEGGYIFDWVRGDYGHWVVDAMDRGLIPCLRVQDCNGGCDPGDGHPEIVANIIREHLAQHRPEYLNRLIYFQIWNEPGDPRDLVSPERYADHLVAAYAGVKRADPNGVFRVMTPGQNGPSFWERAIRHNPAVCQAFDVWATHPYPESYPPHYNHHDGVPYINQVKTIDSYLLDLDAVARVCDEMGSPRRGFPVMITETAYGDHLGISYEGYPKTTRGDPCFPGDPCEYKMAAHYNVAAFSEFWHQWPEVLAVHPFILNNWAWDHFAFVAKTSGSRDDLPIPSWCPPHDPAAATPWPPGYSTGAQRCGLPDAPYPQYNAIWEIPKPLPSSFEPYRGPVGSLRGAVMRADTGDPVKYATVFTDGREFGGPSLYDGQFAVRDVPVGTYTLSVEKVGYLPTSTTVTIREGEETVVDFALVYQGKVSKGVYFQNRGTCNGCDLFAPFLGQTFVTPPDLGFIKFVAAMPNVGNVTMKFSILEDGPTGPQVGESVTAFLEWGGEMIGAEFVGDGVPVDPDRTYFLKIERADGQGVYLYGTDANPYPDGMAYTGSTPHANWDLFATIRGNTTAADAAVGTLSGLVEDTSSTPLGGALVTAHPGDHSATTGSDGRYSLPGLAPGSYSVSASLSGYSSQTLDGIEVFENQTTLADFALARETTTGAIAGTVRDPDGVFLAGATVEASPGNHVTFADANGSYTLPSLDPGSYNVAVSLSGYETAEQTGVIVNGGETTTLDVTLTPVPATPANLIANGDFTQGLASWSTWVERGPLEPRVNALGQLELAAVGHNGGVYQQFATGGAGTEITIEGFWASQPTASASQWAEVLVINGPGAPIFGQDINEGTSGVVLSYKNDTWASPGGWSGVMSQTSPVRSLGSFVANGDVATIILKSGNLQGVDSGILVDDIVVRSAATPPPPPNHPPNAVVTGDPSSGTVPLEVQFDGTGSSDPDGDTLSYEWDFGDGSPVASGATASHTYTAAGDFDVTLTVDDGNGGNDSAGLTIYVEAITSIPSLIINGDFSSGLDGWSVWTERGALSPTVGADGRARVAATDYNGGIYQQFATGGAGTEVQIDGFWASDPTVPNGQWAEVLILDGPRQPVNGQDIHSGQSDVVLIYKNDTWATPSGWSGTMEATSPVASLGSFVASSDVATLLLKSGNIEGATSGVVLDDILVTGSGPPPPPVNQNPVAVAAASPTSGAPPLTVSFDGSGSTDPDGDTLGFTWDFGDGQQASGETISHTYSTAGSFTATLTVEDGRGGSDSDSVVIVVSSPVPPPVGVDWDSRLDSLGIFVIPAVVAPGQGYWKLVRARFESDGEILPPPGGGNESGGQHSIFMKVLDETGNAIENQKTYGAWPTGAPTNVSEVFTKGPVDDYWGDFAMAGGWCPFYPEGPNGPYGAYVGDSPSDQVWGMGMPCNRHVSYRLTWQWAVNGPAPNNPPSAVASASPVSGEAPLDVLFDATGSSDPDGDTLSYSWSFGDGQQGSGPSTSHTYENPGDYAVTLTVDDGRGETDTDSLTINVTSAPLPGGPNLVVNGGFENGFTDGLADGWSRWSTSGTGYWKPSSRLGRIGAGVYASGGQEFLDTVIRLRPKVVLLFDQALGMAPALRAALPDAILIGRLYIDHLVGQYLAEPERWGRHHAEECYRTHQEKGGVFDAWQGLNEPFMNTVEDAIQAARFEKAFSDRLQELGLKSVVLNLAVGNPGDIENMLLPEVVDVLETADYVGYHAYGGIDDQLMVGPQSPWFAHRWRMYADMYEQHGYRMPPVIYTEATTFYGWKGVFEPWQIRDDLIAFERESRIDPWAVGLAIFTFGLSSGDWVGWEVSSEPVIYEGAGDHNETHPADAVDGLHSQQIGSDGGDFMGGIVQRIGVEPGSSYQITTSMKYRTYRPGMQVVYRVGFDLTGQTTDGNASSISWGNDLIAVESRETDTWTTSSQLFTASGSAVSIWIASSASDLEPFRISVDEVTVEKIGAAPPPPPPPPPPPAPEEPDVVVSSLAVSPSHPNPGQSVAFSAVVRNVGTASTPNGVVIGVAYFIDGGYVTWGTVPGPLAPGASVTVPTTGGTWSATSGNHTLTALVDDIDRFEESNEDNNSRSTEFVVGGQAPATGYLYGMNIDPANPAGNPTAQQLKDIGVRWARIEWKARLGYGFYDPIVSSYRTAGLRVLLLVDYASVPGKPASNAGDAEWSNYLSAFTNGVRKIAEHYGDGVDAWQIWNEPDLFHPGSGYDPGVPAHHFGAMLRQSVEVIRVYSTRPIVTGGLASGDPGYLASARNAVGGLTVDAISVHPYGQRAPDNWPNTSWGFGNMSDIFDRYLVFGFPLWVTEIGTVDEINQATYLENVYTLAHDAYAGQVSVVFWFCWSDGMVAPFGVVSPSGEPKPAYHRYLDTTPPW